MLDSGVDIQGRISVNNLTSSIMRTTDGVIHVYANDSDPYSNMHIYSPNGEIKVQTRDFEEIIDPEYKSPPEENQLANGTIIGSYKSLTTTIDYYPNGTNTANEHIQEGTIEHCIREFFTSTRNNPTIKDINNFYTSENITKYPYDMPSYEELLEQYPLRNVDSAAQFFVDTNKSYLEHIDKEQLQKEEILIFTADYGLYWWDYLGGFDVILAELGWNNTIAQEIGLVRGAANLQEKSWGTILTWKYDQPPYLTDGEEMFEQMKTSYQAGAEYILIFNYSEDPENPNTLQEEHFQALEHFWNDVVQNPKIKHGSIKAEAALVLPQNYGWGMRPPEDNIWGTWPANSTTQQIWNQVQNKIETHGLKLDIVYKDPDYTVSEKYANIYYWDQE
ncbi:MAG: hypothetical protein LBB87_03280 [Nitrososphaerota archaeon]|jgi:hypothetical protein|nr:hypothetical protein [Nitrososphaerota archaeon]